MIGIARSRIRPSKEKRRRRCEELAVIRTVRAEVEVRDGHACRLFFATADGPLGGCGGVLEWAHFGESKRWKTRGMLPECRHTTAGSLMMCETHHDAYDEHRLDISPLTDLGADGPLRFSVRGGSESDVWEEQ